MYYIETQSFRVGISEDRHGNKVVIDNYPGGLGNATFFQSKEEEPNSSVCVLSMEDEKLGRLELGSAFKAMPGMPQHEVAACMERTLKDLYLRLSFRIQGEHAADVVIGEKGVHARILSEVGFFSDGKWGRETMSEDIFHPRCLPREPEWFDCSGGNATLRDWGEAKDQSVLPMIRVQEDAERLSFLCYPGEGGEYPVIVTLPKRANALGLATEAENQDFSFLVTMKDGYLVQVPQTDYSVARFMDEDGLPDSRRCSPMDSSTSCSVPRPKL